MKKIINNPENYTDDMLKGIYSIHSNDVGYANNDLRCYHTLHKKQGKVAIITGGGTGHLPLFLGYVGEGMLDGCAVGSVFQSPSAEQIYELSKAVDYGSGVLYLYGNYTGDLMNFDMAAELCEMDGIQVKTIVGSDDVNSASKENEDKRRGVAGIFFMYKAAGAKAMMEGNLEEVLAAAQKAKDNTRTVGFALTPCIIPEIGKPNFTLNENEMAMGMGIHGEPGIWTGPIKTADEIVKESIDTLLSDITINKGDEVSLLINGLGGTSQEELYIMGDSLYRQLGEKGIKVYRSFVGEFATSMEMAGASISIMKLDDELKEYIDMPVNTPFYKQK